MKKSVFHPYLFALFPILFLFNQNFSEGVLFSDVILSLIVSFCFAFIGMRLATFYLKDKYKGAILTSAIILLFFSYGQVTDLLFHLRRYHLQVFAKPRYLLTVWGFLAILAIYVIRRMKTDQIRLSNILNMVSVILILIPLSCAAVQFAREPRDRNIPFSEGTYWQAGNNQSIKAENAPDIYFFILDEYAGLDQIKEVYQYDNLEFVNSLVRKGFFIDRNARINSERSEISIAGMLNAEIPKDKITACQIIRHNAVAKFLKSMGYRYIHAGGWCYGTDYNPLADINVNEFVPGNEFNHLVIKSTLLRPFIDYKSNAFYYRATLSQFDRLSELANMPGPKFLFAHILSPHTPFVFDAQGGRIADRDNLNWKDRSIYLGQYIYVTKRIDRLVEQIMKRSKVPPVIVIVSDHGVRRHYGLKFGDPRRIFSAYYLPDRRGRSFQESVSPMAMLHFILQRYFQTEFAIPASS